MVRTRSRPVNVTISYWNNALRAGAPPVWRFSRQCYQANVRDKNLSPEKCRDIQERHWFGQVRTLPDVANTFRPLGIHLSTPYVDNACVPRSVLQTSITGRRTPHPVAHQSAAARR